MIIEKKTKGTVTVYTVDVDMNEDKMKDSIGKMLRREQIPLIIKADSDVYNTKGELLLRFRKNKLKQRDQNAFYDNVIKFATTKNGTSRKIASGNKKSMSNILGYFDTLTSQQKYNLRSKSMGMPKVPVRETAFFVNHPEKVKYILPLIQSIDRYYKKYVPTKYNAQHKKAQQTPFKLPKTTFTTITTNVNFTTAVHLDRGDDVDGFGNLAVIEYGKYTGGETCLPRYGVGVDVRSGDVLFMNVHEPHGNLPITLLSPDAIRLSIVCYLRTNIWNLTKGTTKQFMETHLKRMHRNVQGISKRLTPKSKRLTKKLAPKTNTRRTRRKHQ